MIALLGVGPKSLSDLKNSLVYNLRKSSRFSSRIFFVVQQYIKLATSKTADP